MGKIYTIGLATFAATGSFLFGYDSGILYQLTAHEGNMGLIL